MERFAHKAVGKNLVKEAGFVIRTPKIKPWMITVVSMFAYASIVAAARVETPYVTEIVPGIFIAIFAIALFMYEKSSHGEKTSTEFLSTILSSCLAINTHFYFVLRRDGTVFYRDLRELNLEDRYFRKSWETVRDIIVNLNLNEEQEKLLLSAIKEYKETEFISPVVIKNRSNFALKVTPLSRPSDYFIIYCPRVYVPGSGEWGNLLDASPIATAVLDKSLQVNNANRAFVELVQKQGSYSLLDIIAPEDNGKVKNALQGLKGIVALDVKLLTAKSSNMMIQAVCADSGSILVHLIDVAEQKNLELKLTHSQKMQAVGQLAGGIAHDFNNLLTAMIGFCDLLLSRHTPEDLSYPDIMQIKQNANRAANLVRQLLAFSRRQVLQPKVLDVTDVISELSNLLGRLLGEKIKLNIQNGRDLWKVKVDQGQLEQVTINLAVNARDAMPEGGKLSIITANVKIEGDLPATLLPAEQEDKIVSGEYVQIKITDTGTGIPPEVVGKIFEPFFSTKEVGAGTGLGLATVLGIVKQTGGYIYFQTESGVGTSFYIYLKRYDESADQNREVNNATTDKILSSDLSGHGTVLLVEDETPVRIFSSRALSNKGYTVIEADSAETALSIIGERGGEIDLIVSDVIMPGMNGPAMAQEIAKTYPDIKVIFISGYAEDVFANTYGSEAKFNFLAKPFTLKQLAGKVKEVMEEGK